MGKQKKALDKTKVLLLVACLALLGIVAWQQSSAFVAPPKPLQLSRPAPAPGSTPTVNAAPPVVARTTEPAAAAPATPKSSEPKKPAPRREVRTATPPAAESRSNAAPASPAPAPVTASKPAAPSTSRPADATTPGNEESDRAIQMARQGEYKQARELLEAALRNGGQASFTLIHDHSKGNFEKDPKASCVGPLTVSPTEIKFDGVGAGDSHHFAASWSEFLEAGSNRFFGSGIGGFHVTIKPEGKYQNINLAPKSKEKADAKLIVELLNAGAKQRTDRSK
jgi:hypothetical protein